MYSVVFAVQVLHFFNTTVSDDHVRVYMFFRCCRASVASVPLLRPCTNPLASALAINCMKKVVMT